MNFTTVLVTQPSRTNYLEQGIACLDRALVVNPNMNLLVIFNGKSDLGEVILAPLLNKHAGRVRFSVILENSPLQDQIVSIIRRENLRWIHMPGDDDLVNAESYREFNRIVEANPEVVAVAFEATAIDASGVMTGKTLKPLDPRKSSKASLIAQALHKPPFVWPSLMFDFGVLPLDIFCSRFVFDWWVGLNLIIRGRVMVSRRILVSYRIHNSQESVLTSEIRKRFEAEMMIQATLFQKEMWLTLNQEIDPKELLVELNRRPPIYGDPSFGATILLLLHNCLAANHLGYMNRSEDFLGRFAEQRGVFLDLREFPGFGWRRDEFPRRFNFQFRIKEETCIPVRKALNEIFDLSGQTLGLIGCFHSKNAMQNDGRSIQVDCGKSLTDLPHIPFEDYIQRQIELYVAGAQIAKVPAASWELIVITSLRRALRTLRRLSLILVPRK